MANELDTHTHTPTRPPVCIGMQTRPYAHAKRVRRDFSAARRILHARARTPLSLVVYPPLFRASRFGRGDGASVCVYTYYNTHLYFMHNNITRNNVCTHEHIGCSSCANTNRRTHTRSAHLHISVLIAICSCAAKIRLQQRGNYYPSSSSSQYQSHFSSRAVGFTTTIVKFCCESSLRRDFRSGRFSYTLKAIVVFRKPVWTELDNSCFVITNKTYFILLYYRLIFQKNVPARAWQK